MTRYAEGTSVSVIKTRMEIEALLGKLGCQELGSSQDEREAHVFFRKDNWRVAMHMALPSAKAISDAYHEKTWRRMSADALKNAVDQRTREAWRGLLLVLKAKFAALDNGIETFEEAFLAHIQLHTGQSIGQAVLPKLRELVQRDAPLMLGAGEARP